ncbi:aldolase [Lysinibacillus agricola]|uniref:Aldolase n=1 Tax=Lysinibacillus agricola TaxID=2590012 RepID=A0ABX7AQW5_9BACI|nr:MULTISPECIES: hypothetical protein [Lysinibacillus]KOS61639.1 aldolase [Lysinibacillus sp. FJAT-14222]QQP12346.1 aldolase [Lysinibacillus agricola]
MYLYCERVLWDYKQNAYELVFDFYLREDLTTLSRFADLESNNNNTNLLKTLLVLNKVKVESYKGPRPGYWYDIPIEFFEKFLITETEPEYSLIKFNLTMQDNNELNFQQYRTINDELFINNETMNFHKCNFYNELNKLKDENNPKLIIRDVGCGNWNEIIWDDFHLIYDLGGDVKFKESEMNTIINRANLTKKFNVVISHWDLDHYRAILDLNDTQIKLMENIVVPSKMPNTLQLNNAFNRLQSSGINIDILSPAHKTKSGRRIELVSQGKVNNLELFRSSDGSNMNQSGIVITIEGNEKIGVLTGDHHYPQIYNNVLNVTSVKSYVIVVPHHGGNAGEFNKNIWDTLPLSEGALSTKSFRYRNLPQNKIHKFFIEDKSFHCTECHSSDFTSIL